MADALHAFLAPVRFLSGIGPARADVLEAAGIETVLDLLQHYPRRHLDRSNTVLVRDLAAVAGPVTIVATVRATGEIKGRGPRRFEVACEDTEGQRFRCVWFRRTQWVSRAFHAGDRVAFHGRPKMYRGEASMPHPEFDKLDDEGPQLDTGRIIALYPGTSEFEKVGLTSRSIRKVLFQLFRDRGLEFPEILPAWIRDRHDLMEGRVALRAIHFPKNAAELEAARRRLIFEELFFVQLMLGTLRATRTREAAQAFGAPGRTVDRFIASLPFKLTAGQRRVIDQISRDLMSGSQMNRLLQGDVGSGKTVVAVAAMLHAVDSGFQTAFMAPTEILAEQHYSNLRQYFDFLEVNTRLLVGGQRKAQRREILNDISSGNARIVVGTHALIQEGVEFARLGLAVIDEQHRFGVLQRAEMFSKGTRPHMLLMTATPIPRSLALTLYGDLDVSTMREKPAHQHPIRTVLAVEKRRPRVYSDLAKALKDGRQVYIVYPLVAESEKLDLKDAISGYEAVKEAFPSTRVDIVHGRMNSDEKDLAMKRFGGGETGILVATTVIEVGVDVPNATIMVIEHAERFGLSQLHQLRGRVGRGPEASTCYLMVAPQRTNDSDQRLEAMVNTDDGFKISETDLRLRGAGNFFGTKQSGIADFRIADLARDVDVLIEAREAARALTEDDPGLLSSDNAVLRAFYLRFYADRFMPLAKIG